MLTGHLSLLSFRVLGKKIHMWKMRYLYVVYLIFLSSLGVTTSLALLDAKLPFSGIVGV